MVQLRLPNGVRLDRSVAAALTWAWLAALLVVAIAMQQVLPPRYFYDSETIASHLQQHPVLSLGAGSFPNTAAIYGAFGMDESTAPVGGAVLIVVAMMLAWHAAGRRAIGIGEYAFALLWSLIMTIYLGQLSKDAFVLALVVLLLAFVRQRFFLAWLGLAVAYAVYVRAYWLLVIGLTILALVLQGRVRTIFGWVLVSLAVYAVLAILFEVAIGQSLTYARDIVNAARMDSPDAETMILNPFPGDGLLLGWLNAVLSAGSLIVPVPLFLHGGPQHVVTAALLVATFLILAWSVRRQIAAQRMDLQSRRVVAILWGFLLTQGLFEPDYGSFLRHLTPVIPLVFFMWAKSLPLRSRETFACA